MQVTNQEKFSVDAYSFVDVLQAVQKGVQQGYVIDVETNENYPQQWGTRYVLTMVRPKTEEVKTDTSKAEMTLKIDASAVQDVVDKAVAEVKEMVEQVEQKEQQETKGKPGRKPKQG
ncbi:MAG: hypothetical protein LC100_14795 [Chitinophagales bacterium]|nr:hypothetical protein [Chitinophagales bacterium]